MCGILDFIESMIVIEESDEEIEKNELIKKTEAYYNFLDQSKIPLKFKSASAKKLNRINFDDMIKHKCVLLKGMLGRGKSFAASAYLIEAYLRLRIVGMFIRCHKLEKMEMDNLKALMRKAENAKIVVFDDIGYIQNNAFVKRLVTSVILDRIEDDKDTFITTNESIADIFDERDFDKIDADYFMIEFNGEKLRKQK